MQDCDDDFAIATLETIVEGGVAFIFGTPLAAAGVVSVGIGAAWLSHSKCVKSVVRDWKLCRQSLPIN